MNRYVLLTERLRGPARPVPILLCRRCGLTIPLDWDRLGLEPHACSLPVQVRVRFVIQDCWVGLYWKHVVQGWDGGWWESWTFWLTLVPALPVVVTVDRSARRTRAFRRWHQRVCDDDWCSHGQGWRR